MVDKNTRIGFIGLGIMGKPMAQNLLSAGYMLTVYDLNAENVNEMAQAGAQAADSIASLCADSDAILTMLPNSPQVRDVVLSSGGIRESAKPGTVFIDMSSINPIVSKELSAVLEASGIDMLDAPVSGGEPKAIDGTLSFMVGGKESVFDSCKALLSVMGGSVVRCGDIGAGNVTKLCNQIIVAANIAAVGEALMLGQMAGVSPDTIYQAIRGGLAGSTVIDAKAPMMMDRNFKPGFKIDLHIKDLTNVLDTANALNAPAILTSSVMEMMKTLHREGEGQSDHSALVKFYEQLTGVEVHR